jgi:hypothetical protein
MVEEWGTETDWSRLRALLADIEVFRERLQGVASNRTAV